MPYFNGCRRAEQKYGWKTGDRSIDNPHQNKLLLAREPSKGHSLFLIWKRGQKFVWLFA